MLNPSIHKSRLLCVFVTQRKCVFFAWIDHIGCGVAARSTSQPARHYLVIGLDSMRARKHTRMGDLRGGKRKINYGYIFGGWFFVQEI